MSPIALPPPPLIRVATPADIPEIVRVTNCAYEVEAFCLRGARTDAGAVRADMQEGQFLVLEDPADASKLRGSVFVSIARGRGYLSTLAVAPDCQGQGLAKALVGAVEAHCRAAGCGFLGLSVVNLRRELFPFYGKLGFAASAVLPFPRPDKLLQPLHLIQMTKPLRAGGSSNEE